MNAIGFVVANLILLKQYVSLRVYIYIIFSGILFSIIVFLNLDSLDNDGLNRLAGTNYIDAIKLVKDFYIFSEIPARDEIDTSLWSLWYRLNLWAKLLEHYLNNFFTVLFGAGVYRVYFESTILRIIFTTGLVGFIYIMYCSRKLELYMLAYFVTVGITLDIFNSFKIFCITMLFYRFYYEDYSNRRN